MCEPEMERVATLMDAVLAARDDATIERVRGDVQDLSREFPLYAGVPVTPAASARGG
jgi:glycine/serine hydroxymethyltransferase